MQVSVYHPPIDEQDKEIVMYVYIYTMKSFPAMKKNKILFSAEN